MVEIGLPYTSTFETLRAEVPGPGGSSQGQKKRMPKVNIRAIDTMGIKINGYQQPARRSRRSPGLARRSCSRATTSPPSSAGTPKRGTRSSKRSPSPARSWACLGSPMSPTTETLPAGITLTPFRAADAFAMRLTPQATQSFAGVDLVENFRLYEEKGVGWTMRVGDTIVGCAGLMFPWPSRHARHRVAVAVAAVAQLPEDRGADGPHAPAGAHARVPAAADRVSGAGRLRASGCGSRSSSTSCGTGTAIPRATSAGWCGTTGHRARTTSATSGCAAMMREHGCPRRPLRPLRVVPVEFPNPRRALATAGPDVVLYVAIASARHVRGRRRVRELCLLAGPVRRDAVQRDARRAAGRVRLPAGAGAGRVRGRVGRDGSRDAGASGRRAWARWPKRNSRSRSSRRKPRKPPGTFARPASIAPMTARSRDVRAAIGKSGVDTTGSPLLVLMENADTVGMELAINDYQTALDVAGAKTSGAFSAAESRMRAGALQQEATLRRFGAQATAAGYLGGRPECAAHGGGPSRDAADAGRRRRGRRACSASAPPCSAA